MLNNIRPLWLTVGAVLMFAAPMERAAAQAAASQPSPDATARASPDSAYVLGPGDVIDVSAPDREDFKARDKIGVDGTVTLPYLGATPAANKTTDQLGADITSQLAAKGFFPHLTVKVEVASYASRYVIVLGSVANPGLVPIDRGYHLSEIIARTGGVRQDAADYVILRPENGPELRLLIKDLAAGDASQDPLVPPGAKIFVPAAEVFYISGQVKSPGSYPLAGDMTIRMALSRAGGLTDSGSEHKIRVVRQRHNLDHVDLDGRVEPGDVIVAGESLF